MKKDWSNYGVVVLLPILCVAILYAAEALNRGFFFVCSNQESCESIPGNLQKALKIDPGMEGKSTSELKVSDGQYGAIALRYRGRINWFLIMEIFVFASITSLAIGVVIASLILRGYQLLWGVIILALALLVGWFFFTHPELHMVIFLHLFDLAITPDLPKIGFIMNLMDSLANAAIFSLLIAICTTLLPLQSDSGQDGLKQLSTRMRYLRIILYTGTFLLVAGILLKKTIYDWALGYFVQDDTISLAQAFLETLLTMDGAFYTLVLAAAYFPASLVLHRRAQLLLGPTLDEAEREARLKGHGLNFSLKDSLPRILAILGPFLTGSAADLLTRNIF